MSIRKGLKEEKYIMNCELFGLAHHYELFFLLQRTRLNARAEFQWQLFFICTLYVIVAIYLTRNLFNNCVSLIWCSKGRISRVLQLAQEFPLPCQL